MHQASFPAVAAAAVPLPLPPPNPGAPDVPPIVEEALLGFAHDDSWLGDYYRGKSGGAKRHETMAGAPKRK